MKIYVLALFIFVGIKGFSQQKDSLKVLKSKEIIIVAHDSARLALDIVVDTSGRLITATYAADSSTTNDKKMIELAKRRAREIKYPARKVKYTQKLIFNFKVVH
jgi:hypothetical protein